MDVTNPTWRVHVTSALPYRSEQLGALLEVFSIWSTGEFIRGLAVGAGVDLDATSIAAVTILARDGDQRASTLASHLHVGASAISKLTNRLGSKRLIEKRTDPGDSRATLLGLTPAGTDTATALVRAGDAMMLELVGDWPEEDRTHFAHLLRRFRDAVMTHALDVQAPKPSTHTHTHTHTHEKAAG